MNRLRFVSRRPLSVAPRILHKRHRVPRRGLAHQGQAQRSVIKRARRLAAISGIICDTMSLGQKPRVVLDTNVLVSALRSRLGASFRLLQLVGRDRFEHVITVPLVIELEDVLHRPGMVQLTANAVADVLDYVCATGIRQRVHFLWRPQLPDIKDDMVLEAAVNGSCTHIVTHNVRDLALARRFKIQVVTPQEFLHQLKESRS